MPQRRMLVLVIEGLSTNLLGPYGANLARTPTLDQLAAEGIVLDQCFVDAVSPTAQRSSLWTGVHAAQRALPTQSTNSSTNPTSIWQLCEQAGIKTSLWTDSEEVALQAEEAGCREATLVPATPNATGSSPSLAAELEDCQCLNLLSAVSECLAADSGAESVEAELVWVHSRGLQLPWDAPLELRAQFVDPEDPDPPSECETPSIPITPETDPDLVIGWGQVAAAQTHVIDEGIAAIMASLESRTDSAQWSWLLTSLGGVAMGEQDWLGVRHREEQTFLGLHGQELQTATILRVADADTGIGFRYHPICQLPDLAATIFELLGLSSIDSLQRQRWGQSLVASFESQRYNGFPCEWPPSQQIAFVADPSMDIQWIACPAWSAVLEESGNALGRLYVKPEDRWEVNNVAHIRRDILDDLKEALDEYLQAIATGDRHSLTPMPDSLTNLIR